jgi:pimeloyl-ACP methyl ester carboxylesterase
VRRIFVAALLLFTTRLAIADDGWQPFVLRSYDGRESKGEIARLPVRENRSVVDSRRIRVAVIRLPSRGAKSGSPPIVFLSGGPGIPASALARVPVYFDLFTKLQAVGDVLLLDQRGSGMSAPNLTCPAGDVPKTFLSSDDAFREVLRSRVAACARFWSAGGLDLHGYSTREIAADVDAARRAAGARTMKLLAFSYGSEVAIEVAQRWPGTVERIVFASTRAPDTLLKLAGEWDRQLATIGELAGLPLPAMVGRVVTKLDAKPVDVETPDGTFPVGGIAVLTALRGDLPDGRALPKIPAFVRALDEGDYAPLVPRVQQLYKSLQSLNLMTLAVDCSSGWSRRRLDLANAQAGAALMRNVNLQWHRSICDAAIGGAGTPTPIGPIDVPALFITGTLDVNAPAAQTDAVRKAFRRSGHVLVENGAHETLPADAVQERVIHFLRGERVGAERIVLPRPSGLEQ